MNFSAPKVGEKAPKSTAIRKAREQVSDFFRRKVGEKNASN